MQQNNGYFFIVKDTENYDTELSIENDDGAYKVRKVLYLVLNQEVLQELVGKYAKDTTLENFEEKTTWSEERKVW